LTWPCPWTGALVALIMECGRDFLTRAWIINRTPPLLQPFDFLEHVSPGSKRFPGNRTWTVCDVWNRWWSE
jgi:hypothetical protein